MASIWAPACQEFSHVGSDGVGVISMKGAPLALPSFATAQFKWFSDCGRAVRCMLPLGSCLFLGTMSLARTLSKVEDLGIWPDGLLDAYIAMIPKSDGDAALSQRPLSVLPIVYRIWASARMGQLNGWFRSWVLDSVFSAGGGRGSGEAWYTTALDIEEVLVPLILIFISLSLM